MAGARLRVWRSLLGWKLRKLNNFWLRTIPATAPASSTGALYHDRLADLCEVTTLPAGPAAGTGGAATPVGWPAVAAPVRVRGRHAPLPAAARRRQDGGSGLDARRRDADTICISTQVGCAVGCKFCLTALLGLERNLTAGEIVGQVLVVARDNGLAVEGERLNIVMMGQGEPLLNLANVVKATRILADPEGVGPVAAAHHALDGRDRSEDRGTGARAGAAQAGHLAERLHRGGAARADADHAQVSPAGSDGGLPRLPAAAVGAADVRVRAAGGRERYGRRRAARGAAAGEPEVQGQSDRAESRARDSVRDAGAGARAGVSGDRQAGHAVLHPQAARAGYLRRLRAVEEQRVTAGEIAAEACATTVGVKKRSTDDAAVLRFVTVAEAFCRELEKRTRHSKRGFIERSLKATLALYSAGLELPDVYPEPGYNPAGECFEQHKSMPIRQRMKEDPELRKHAALYKETRDRIIGALGTDLVYQQVFDPVREREPVAATLSDDLSDIYCDVVNGLLTVADHPDVVPPSVVWQWKFDLQSHWGRHATSAIYAMHCFLADG